METIAGILTGLSDEDERRRVVRWVRYVFRADATDAVPDAASQPHQHPRDSTLALNGIEDLFAPPGESAAGCGHGALDGLRLDDPYPTAVPDLPDRRPELSRGLKDLDCGLVDEVASVRPSFAGEPSFLATLEDLDRGLLDVGDKTGTLIPRPPLTACLIVPDAPPRRRLRQRRPAKMREEPSQMAGHVSALTATAALVLAMSLGAAAAAFVFHERLSQIVVQWETAGR